MAKTNKADYKRTMCRIQKRCLYLDVFRMINNHIITP